MADTASPRRRRWLQILIMVLALGFLGWELYALVPEVRGAVVKSLGWCGPRASMLILSYLRDTDPEVRWTASQTVKDMGSEALPALKQALAQGDAGQRALAGLGLKYLGPQAAPAVPALLEAVRKDPSAEVRVSAVIALGATGHADGEVVQVLADALKDTDPTVRKEAAESLGRFGEKSKGAIPALLACLQDSEPRVRGEAAEALGIIGADTPEIITALTKVTEDADRRVQGSATDALGRLRKHEVKDQAP
jgi:HEAT repeat protein